MFDMDLCIFTRVDGNNRFAKKKRRENIPEKISWFANYLCASYIFTFVLHLLTEFQNICDNNRNRNEVKCVHFMGRPLCGVAVWSIQLFLFV